jgi:hypothetical protein
MHAQMPGDHYLVGMSSPFIELATLSINVRCDDPSLGLVIGACAAQSRAFLVDIKGGSSNSKIRDWRRKYLGDYLVEVNTTPAFTKADAEHLLNFARDADHDHSDPHVELTLAPDIPDRHHPPSLVSHNFKWINSVQPFQRCMN